MDKFAKAFKDPEFLKMFEEYAKEVSDPKVRVHLLCISMICNSVWSVSAAAAG